MNNNRFFDRYQFIITLIGLCTFAISTILFIVMLFTATYSFDENGAVKEVIYNAIVQIIYSIFFLLHLTSVVWFIARALTYKMRTQEEELL